MEAEKISIQDACIPCSFWIHVIFHFRECLDPLLPHLIGIINSHFKTLSSAIEIKALGSEGTRKAKVL